MTVKEFAERLNLKVMIEGEMDREITGRIQVMGESISNSIFSPRSLPNWL